MYVRGYFDQDARQSVDEMVKDIHSVFNEIIEDTQWMNNKTRIHADRKAASMTALITYSEELLNDKTLTDYYQNVSNLNTKFLIK